MKLNVFIAKIEKYYVILAAIVVPVNVAYFFFFALSNTPPAHAIVHYVNVLKYPSIGVCGNDTLDFGKNAAVNEAGFDTTDDGCKYNVSFGAFDGLIFSIGEPRFRKEYVLKLLDQGARLGRFDKAAYIYTCDEDTIYFTFDVLAASDAVGYYCDITAVSPNNGYLTIFSGPGIDPKRMVDAIKKYAYRDGDRQIVYNRALTEESLR